MSTETTATPSKTEVLKNRLKSVKRHIPAIAGFTAALVATVVADHYRREVLKLETFEVDPDWTSIPVPSHMMENLEDGHTLHYRQHRIDEDNCYAQYATSEKSVGFSPELDEYFENAQKEGTETPSEKN